MCTLDSETRKLREEIVLLISSQSWPINFPEISIILRLLRENPDILNSLEDFQDVVWYLSWDGYIEFMPNSSLLFLISVRDESFRVYHQEQITLVGDSDQYLSDYVFNSSCPFFVQESISSQAQELAVEVAAA